MVSCRYFFMIKHSVPWFAVNKPISTQNIRQNKYIFRSSRKNVTFATLNNQKKYLAAYDNTLNYMCSTISYN